VRRARGFHWRGGCSTVRDIMQELHLMSALFSPCKACFPYFGLLRAGIGSDGTYHTGLVLACSGSASIVAQERPEAHLDFPWKAVRVSTWKPVLAVVAGHGAGHGDPRPAYRGLFPRPLLQLLQRRGPCADDTTLVETLTPARILCGGSGETQPARPEHRAAGCRRLVGAQIVAVYVDETSRRND